MNEDQYRVITQAADAGLVRQARSKIHLEWPEFMLHDPVANLLDDCYAELPDFQFVLVDPSTDEAVALGNSIPLAWPGKIQALPDDGWDWALQKGIEDLHSGTAPNLLCALQVVVFGDYKGKGISSYAVQVMKENGRRHGLAEMIAPVRPSRKCDYPLTPIENYIRWQDDSGQPFDPWLRVHVKQGAQIIKPCHESMRITGTVVQWQERTGLRFPESGEYIVPGALVPVKIDVEHDIGVYVEPNVWVQHPPV
ncbi:MAG: hypothetical protein ABIJ61_00045 [bacterium]